MTAPGNEKVSPGQPFRTTPFFKAAFQNDVIDVVAAPKEGRDGKPRNDAPRKFDTNWVQVRNLTEADRARGEIVQLGAHLLTNITRDSPWFEGNTLAAPAYNVGICVWPIKSTKIGQVQISGQCIGKVNVTSTAHTHAVPVAGQHYLESSDFGPFVLEMPAAETGNQELHIAFCDVRPVRLVLTEDIDSGSATAELSAYSSGWSGTSRNYEVYDSIGAVDLLDGDVVWCLWSAESMRLEIIESQPAVNKVATIVHATAGGAMSGGSVTATVTRVLQGGLVAASDTITATDPGWPIETESGTLLRCTSDPSGTFWIDTAACVPE